MSFPVLFVIVLSVNLMISCSALSRVLLGCWIPTGSSRVTFDGGAVTSGEAARNLEHGSAAKTLISHPHNTASYAGYTGSNLHIRIYTV